MAATNQGLTGAHHADLALGKVAGKDPQSRLSKLKSAESSTETFCKNITALWDYAAAGRKLDAKTLANRFPEWNLENVNYNIIRSWTCSLSRTASDLEAASLFGLKNLDMLDSAQKAVDKIRLMAAATQTNTTMFRVVSCEMPCDEFLVEVEVLVYPNSCNEILVAVSADDVLYRVNPPLRLELQVRLLLSRLLRHATNLFRATPTNCRNPNPAGRWEFISWSSSNFFDSPWTSRQLTKFQLTQHRCLVSSATQFCTTAKRNLSCLIARNVDQSFITFVLRRIPMMTSIIVVFVNP
jgi:hypothetical protein